ncbi:MAG: nucleotide exchange factor GrpE [Candidatus Delongbacteria bacterium]|nr:nucleotide exchange factor GrpE [Candidatus Delongbacteria bacterium]
MPESASTQDTPESEEFREELLPENEIGQDSGPDATDNASPEDPAPESGAAMQTELEELRRTVAELNDRHLRCLAEFDNFRRRSQGERGRWHREAQEDVLLSLLPVRDDLERMLNQPVESLGLESLLDGLRLVSGKLVRGLEQYGLNAFDSVGQTFDPELHDALTTVCVPDKADDEIIMEHLRGYRMGDRVIRHAQVVVNKLESADPPADSSAGNEEN